MSKCHNISFRDFAMYATMGVLLLGTLWVLTLTDSTYESARLAKEISQIHQRDQLMVEALSNITAEIASVSSEYIKVVHSVSVLKAIEMMRRKENNTELGMEKRAILEAQDMYKRALFLLDGIIEDLNHKSVKQ
eukprot:Tbor_TRINITY_DN5446_c1_g2::TRINITY_DN5446_c1_g2_i2::g.25337::m.25337